MFNKLKSLMSGKKTQSTLALLMFLEVWAKSKGLDTEAIKMWFGSFLTEIESLKVLLMAAGIWFRQLGKKV